jgi:hypothetical protein
MVPVSVREQIGLLQEQIRKKHADEEGQRLDDIELAWRKPLVWCPDEKEPETRERQELDASVTRSPPVNPTVALNEIYQNYKGNLLLSNERYYCSGEFFLAKPINGYATAPTTGLDETEVYWFKSKKWAQKGGGCLCVRLFIPAESECAL